jgi:hypothetical protein
MDVPPKPTAVELDAAPAALVKPTELAWRTRDLRRAVDASGKDFLSREIALGASTGQRMSKTLKDVQAINANLRKVCLAHDGLRP